MTRRPPKPEREVGETIIRSGSRGGHRLNHSDCRGGGAGEPVACRGDDLHAAGAERKDGTSGTIENRGAHQTGPASVGRSRGGGARTGCMVGRPGPREGLVSRRPRPHRAVSPLRLGRETLAMELYGLQGISRATLHRGSNQQHDQGIRIKVLHLEHQGTLTIAT